MESESNFCRCCREPIVHDVHHALCHACRPWNDADQLIRESTPAWQGYLQSNSAPILDEVLEWFHTSGVLSHLLPSDEAWAALLREVSGREQIRWTADPLEGHCESSVLTALRERLASRNSALFPGERAVVDHDSEVEGHFAGHHLKTAGVSLVVDGVRVDRGPGLLLFRMMTERKDEPAAHRFLKILRLIEGDCAAESQQLHKRRRAMLRDGRFQTAGAADAPRFDEQNGYSRPPPLCDWDSDRYLLGIEVASGGRYVIPLPVHPHLIEQFLTIWSGRPNMRVSDRLRALCLQWALNFGTEAPQVRITPHERSFGLLRSIVDANSEAIICQLQGMRITGALGVTWRVSPGRGVHGSPYTIRPSSLDGRVVGPAICMYDGGPTLPLGDRLASVALGLLNDNLLARQFVQIAAAVHRVRMIEAIQR
jgi:hypothetical protein